MALTVRTDGTAVVEEPKGTTAAAGAVADSGETVKDTTTTTKTTTTAVPEAATACMDFKTVQQNLNTTYDSKYDDQLADLYNQITQRKPFSYSTDDDMLYQQYLQKYTQQGKQAMKDTMGQTAALTGGYGNSYGQVAGQQTYDAFLQELNNLLPELQNAAYQKYAAEGDRLMQMYGLLGDMEDRDMNQFKLNQTVNQSAYERFMNEAALKGAAGDFSGYEDIFGKDSADKMQQTYNLDRLLPYLQAGLINQDQFNQLLAPFLSEMGIVTPKVAASGGGGWEGNWYGNDSSSNEGPYVAWSDESDNLPFVVGAMNSTSEGALAEIAAAAKHYADTGRLPADFY
jgi:hypothetical protein